ncbi:hypothetical protein QR680_013104 [Steinernema hermaphroditum]|uniref:Uncharacterized protein n=1 Tax=Steinernema hermaphroditum TaxID=289476 RepID=A0AA39I4D8_9BILA|nr:hypothetical protein QR680_013104 [Steinernema hermaphroditum]
MDSGNSMDARAVGDHEPGDFPNVDTGRRRRAHAPVPRRAKKCTRSPTPSRHLAADYRCGTRAQCFDLLQPLFFLSERNGDDL